MNPEAERLASAAAWLVEVAERPASMSKRGWATAATYAYQDPHSRRIAFWRERLSAPDGRKTFRTLVPPVPYSGLYRHGTVAEPPPVAASCLYRLAALRQALASPRSGGGVVLLTEGEKDANSGARLNGVTAATSHWGGACDMTPDQAQHLTPVATARGRRWDGRRVLIVVDRDDPGYADGLHRWELLRGLGLRRYQMAVVRPADGVVAGGKVCTGRCECEMTCPLPEKAWQKADLTDHVAAGRALSELVPVPEGELRAGAERWAAERAAGAAYGVTLTAEVTALARADGWTV